MSTTNYANLLALGNLSTTKGCWFTVASPNFPPAISPANNDGLTFGWLAATDLWVVGYQTGQLIAVVGVPNLNIEVDPSNYPVAGCGLGNNLIYITSSSEMFLAEFTLTSASLITSLGNAPAKLTMLASSKATNSVWGSDGNVIYCYSVDSQTWIQPSPFPTLKSPITSLACAAGIVYVGYENGVIQSFQESTPTQACPLPVTTALGSIVSMAAVAVPQRSWTDSAGYDYSSQYLYVMSTTGVWTIYLNMDQPQGQLLCPYKPGFISLVAQPNSIFLNFLGDGTPGRTNYTTYGVDCVRGVPFYVPPGSAERPGVPGYAQFPGNWPYMTNGVGGIQPASAQDLSSSSPVDWQWWMMGTAPVMQVEQGITTGMPVLPTSPDMPGTAGWAMVINADEISTGFVNASVINYETVGSAVTA